jgi:plastocyanin domain-containing protein
MTVQAPVYGMEIDPVYAFAKHEHMEQTFVSESAAQEVAVTRKGGYAPDVIFVKHGRPTHLTCTRHEISTCSEQVLFPDINQSAFLPEGQEVLLEFTPEDDWEYGFQCQMGMRRGNLIVE